MEPIKPKGPSSAYIFFNTEYCAKLRDQENISNSDVMKSAGAAWKLMTEKEKEKYNQMAEKD